MQKRKTVKNPYSVKPLPSATEPVKGGELPFFYGPGKNVPKAPKDYSKKGGK